RLERCSLVLAPAPELEMPTPAGFAPAGESDADMSRTIRHDRTPSDDRDPRPTGDSLRDEEDVLADDPELGFDDELADEFAAPTDDDTALDTEPVSAEDEAPADEDYASGPDDALGLYLRQMGAIPLLTRDKELSLAQRLEHHRNRFRAAALLCPRVLARTVEKFEQIAAGQTPLDPNVDVYSSEDLRLSRMQVVSRLTN